MGVTGNSEDNYSDNVLAGGAQRSGNPSDETSEDTVSSAEAVGEYRESDEHVPDPTAMTGTLDTSGIAPGAYEDLRNVTQTFNASDARVADALESDEGAYSEVSDEDTRADSAQALRERSGTTEGQDAKDAATSPSESLPGEQPHGVDAASEPRSTADPEVTSPADGDTTHPVESPVEDPADEKDGQADGQTEQSDGAAHLGQADGTADSTTEGTDASADSDAFNPDEKSVREVKAYLATADADEVERVKAAEAQGQNRPAIANFTAK